MDHDLGRGTVLPAQDRAVLDGLRAGHGAGHRVEHIEAGRERGDDLLFPLAGLEDLPRDHHLRERRVRRFHAHPHGKGLSAAGRVRAQGGQDELDARRRTGGLVQGRALLAGGVPWDDGEVVHEGFAAREVGAGIEGRPGPRAPAGDSQRGQRSDERASGHGSTRTSANTGQWSDGA